MALCLLTPAALAAEPTAHAEEYAEENAVTVTADAGDAAEGDPLYDYMLRTAKEQMKPKTGKRLLARTPEDVTYARVQLPSEDKSQDLYDKIKAKVVALDDAILKRQGTDLSTSFTFPVSEFGYDNTVWTNSDLGLEPGSLLEIGESEKYHLTAAAQEAIDNKISGIVTDILGNFSLVHAALLSDCPYYFYWYNKQGGYSFGHSGYSVTGYQDKVTVSGLSITVAFAVASDYGGAYTQKENETPVYTGNYTINTADAAFDKIQTALDNAQSIVTTNADKSDFEKLTAYKNAICDAVAYDDGAAGRSATATDTNPWQLIYALDGVETTNVVCEGYAKAFKYLCDLSTFDANIQCYLVSGDMAVSSQGNDEELGGAHMWNVVTMDDGKNYLVDVTNCDTGSIGATDDLFLKGMDMRGTTNDGGVWCSKGIDNNVIYYAYDGETLGLWENTNANVLIVSLSDYVPLTADHDAVSISVTNGGTNEGVVTVSGMLRPGNRVLLAKYRDGRLVLAKVVQENTTNAACYFDVSDLDAFRVMTDQQDTLQAFVVDESFRPTIESQVWSS